MWLVSTIVDLNSISELQEPSICLGTADFVSRPLNSRDRDQRKFTENVYCERLFGRLLSVKRVSPSRKTLSVNDMIHLQHAAGLWTSDKLLPERESPPRRYPELSITFPPSIHSLLRGCGESSKNSDIIPTLPRVRSVPVAAASLALLFRRSPIPFFRRSFRPLRISPFSTGTKFY